MMETSVLIIEDNEGDYIRMRAYLSAIRNSKIKLDWVNTYENGLREMISNRYDVYLLDYLLGEFDGLELLKEAISKGCTHPVIFLTGYGDIQLDMRAMECGAADFLDKNSVDSALLERSIRYTVQNWRYRCNLESALKEKEALLKEVHHRVKNNLQVISSMLRLQSRKFQEPTIKNVLQECCDRIRSIGIIHEQLYRSKDLEAVNFSDYIHTLVKQLINAYSIDTERIVMELSITHAHIPLSMAVPCGLMVHELLNNSLKHAFPNGRRGRVSLIFSKKSPNNVELIVKDDGIGIDPQLSSKNTDSLGIELVHAFAAQLKAKLSLTSESGTEWRVQFKESDS